MDLSSAHAAPSIQVADFLLQLQGDLAHFHATLTAEEIKPHLHLVHLSLTSPTPVTPQPLKLTWSQPIVDIQAIWFPGCNAKRWLTLPWEISVQSKATREAPVVSLYNLAGANRLTFACSDVLNHIETTASIHEGNAAFSCHFHFFAQPTAPLREYKVTLRIDRRALSYHRVLNDVQSWWASLPGITPSPVPDVARLPMYSTWYSFHQELTDAEVEHQCRLAKQLGCEAVIIDDGWQTEDNSGGYAYCGDWEVTPKKFPDLRAHIDRLHAMGMKSLLWFSVPFVGPKTRVYDRFKGKYLTEDERLHAATLDPRFPDVREYLIALYEKAIRDWDLDGLKLDFVDRFNPTAANYNDGVTGRDIDSVPEAVDRLLRDTMVRLRKLKPDVLIEFRQAYIGPLMRNYGNLFRAADCPNDAICNRVRTIDVRLLSGNTATHSDMLMWSLQESPESAALQFLNILFAVPQISVKLDKIPASHLQMLRFWLGFWREHRDVLLDGTLEPLSPELQYPFIVAKKASQWIGAFYADVVAPLREPLPPELWFVNAAHQSRVVVELPSAAGTYQIEEYNVLGELVETRNVTLTAGLHALKVSPSGLLHLKRG
ncbi:MAG: alpha-galactosidase [Verrucomicrobia bacterium Tous-C9LFEB]|nr:MAG: alpha-galactosidase [Verrucomicrobia bacterium Tous-C9LFEB]